MADRKQALARNRQKKLQRRKHREQKSRAIAPSVTLPHKLSERLYDACALIRRGDYTEAEELLQKLDSRGTNYAEVVETLLYLYQSMGDHDRCCQTAERLTGLRPRDPEIHLMYAQESMYCGRTATALLNYEQFLERWPDHTHATKAKNAIRLLVPETENTIKAFGFSKENGLQLLALHEESLSLMQSGKFSACIPKCQDLLAKAPTFVSARNNLAIANFQSGRSKDAVATVEKTRQLVPDNRFAEVTLAKLYFLTGRGADAHQLADKIVANPPTQQEALVATLEMLGFLGRDEDIVRLAEAAMEDGLVDEHCRARQYHYLAYAKCRLGDEKTARAFWKKCLKMESHHPDARENVLDLDSGVGHAPWADSLGKWIPKVTLDQAIESMGHGKQDLQVRFPAIAMLVPALLDRGDPFGREVAMLLAMADGSRPMLDALKNFALGLRGPDSMRLKVLTFLREKAVIDAGPHRVYHRGKWADIELFAAKISTEPDRLSSSARVVELMTAGIEAMQAGRFDLAEAAFQKALLEEPDNCKVVYNLCVIWLRRDGKAGRKRARARLEQLHGDFPDYAFASIALAQFAAMDGEFERARSSLAPFFQADKLHISEATALFTTQVQISIEEGDLDEAERVFELLCQFANKDDSNVQVLRRRIDNASKKGLRGIFSKS